MRFLIIDGHSLIHRAYHAMPQLNGPDGTKTGAITGFFNMMFLARDMLLPDICAAAFDAHGNLFRREVLPQYKANRAGLDDDLKSQIKLTQELLRLMGCPVFAEPGVEADDIIGTLALKAIKSDDNNEIIILSSDKDLMQLINKNIKLLRPVSRGVSHAQLYDKEAFKNEYGFEPNLMADFLALTGDAADNIPGVTGIGGIGATQLISQIGNINKIFDAAEDESNKNLKQSIRKKLLAAGRENTLKIRDIVRLRTDLDFDLNLYKNIDIDVDGASALASRLGLKGVLKRLNVNLNKIMKINKNFKSDNIKTEKLKNKIELKERDRNFVVIFTPDLESRYFVAAFPDNRCEKFEFNFDFDIDKINKIITENSRYKILTSDYKFILNKTKNFINASWDLRTAHYLLHPDISVKTFNYLIEDIVNRAESSGSLFDVILDLKNEFDDKINNYIKLNKIMTELDMPLLPVLNKMERHGVKILPEKFKNIQAELETKIYEIEKNIEYITGESINLNSPRQVSDLLFQKMGLSFPDGKKGKIRGKKGDKTFYSTEAAVLEKLVKLVKLTEAQVPKFILEYRELSKILNSFVIPLQQAADKNNIIHTTFDAASTGTGRLTSQNPNLQNLPAFGEWALKLKSGLTPLQDGNVFVSADYSQIELRVLAHLSQEDRLLEAFNNKRDIHAETASWVFSVEPEFVTPELRRTAKVVNFGLLYGMNQFGLAERLGVSHSEAMQIMRRYFSALPGVKKYLDEITDEALSNGYAETLFGRVRPVNEIQAKGDALRRVLINSPIQGTAADITRRAMINLYNEIKDTQINLFLQVHDSLVCECPPDMAERTGEILRKNMEQAASLSLPLEVNIKTGLSLADI